MKPSERVKLYPLYIHGSAEPRVGADAKWLCISPQQLSLNVPERF